MPGLLQPERKLEWTSDGYANVSVKSFFSGKWHTLSLPLTQDAWDRWQAGEYIQTALFHLTPDEREFLLTGATVDEWNAAFAEDED